MFKKLVIANVSEAIQIKVRQEFRSLIGELASETSLRGCSRSLVIASASEAIQDKEIPIGNLPGLRSNCGADIATLLSVARDDGGVIASVSEAIQDRGEQLPPSPLLCPQSGCFAIRGEIPKPSHCKLAKQSRIDFDWLKLKLDRHTPFSRSRRRSLREPEGGINQK